MLVEGHDLLLWVGVHPGEERALHPLVGPLFPAALRVVQLADKVNIHREHHGVLRDEFLHLEAYSAEKSTKKLNNEAKLFSTWSRNYLFNKYLLSQFWMMLG